METLIKNKNDCENQRDYNGTAQYWISNNGFSIQTATWTIIENNQIEFDWTEKISNT